MTYVALILQNNQGEYLLERRPETGLLAKMWQFPLIKVEDIITDGTWKPFKPVILEALDAEQKDFIEHYMIENYQVPISISDQTSGVVQHIFSHLKWKVSIFDGKIINDSSLQNIPEKCEWVKDTDFEHYTFPTIQKKLWDAFTEITLF